MALPADVIGNILVYACESPKDAAARRWCLSKAWLEAHGAPALWSTLVITSVPFAGAHCTCSAWERAPSQLRRAVERHTRSVQVMDARGETDLSCLECALQPRSRPGRAALCSSRGSLLERE